MSKVCAQCAPRPGASLLVILRRSLSLLAKMAAKIPGYETTMAVTKEGSGRVIGKGDTATVHATGIVKETGKKFWGTHDAGQEPFHVKEWLTL
ncbi:hypothetical protein T492DRAFT_869473 [Pavlovales sp. CCMP2436]|nr:hypothetical protein T492DRAFT_869473 [Pavlovales sp. CCMP2436]